MPKTLLPTCTCDSVFTSITKMAILHRETGDRLVSISMKRINKQKCIDRVVKWINVANFTLDICLFFILHKNIINAIAKKSRMGVRCRVVVYRHWFIGVKTRKHQRYLDLLQRKGVEIRWMSENSGTMSMYRHLFIDCTNDDGRAERAFNEGALIYGTQLKASPHYDITKDFNKLKIIKREPSMHLWRLQFETVWNYPSTMNKVSPARAGTSSTCTLM